MSGAVKVGVFMFVVMVLAGILVLRIEDLPFGKKTASKKVVAEFASVAGLDEKSAVRVAGIRVGKVESIELVGDRARVTLRIDDPNVHLRAGATASVANLGLLGDKYIELSPGPVTGPELAEGAVLGGTVPTGMDDLTKMATSIGGDIKEITSALKDAIATEKGRMELRRIVENVAVATDRFRELLEQNQRGVNATVANFEAFSGTLRKEIPTIAQEIRNLSQKLSSVVDENRSGLRDGIENVRDLAKKLETSADNLNSITTKIAHGEGTIGKLVNSEETHDKLTSALDSVKSGVDTLKDTIGRIGTTRFDMAVRSDYYPDPEEARSALELTVTPKDSRRFYRLDLVATPYGKRKQKTEFITTTFPDGHTETVEITKTKYDESYGLTANVGYRLGDVAVRGGLIESRGGAGIDWTTPLRSLQISAEAFDFSRRDPDGDKKPHFRLSGRYMVNDNLFVSAGYDDPLQKDQRSVFAGGGVTWEDKDIKYLLGSLPLK